MIKGPQQVTETNNKANKKKGFTHSNFTKAHLIALSYLE
mgnify:CR=1 FL=1